MLLSALVALVVLHLQCGASDALEKAPLYMFATARDLFENVGTSAGHLGDHLSFELVANHCYL